MPSPRPVKPRRSEVVALTLTRSGLDPGDAAERGAHRRGVRADLRRLADQRAVEMADGEAAVRGALHRLARGRSPRRRPSRRDRRAGTTGRCRLPPARRRWRRSARACRRRRRNGRRGRGRRGSPRRRASPASPGPKACTSKPLPVRMSMALSRCGRGAGEVGRGGDLEVVLVARRPGRTRGRRPGRPPRRRAASPGWARCAARIVGEAEALRRLRAPEALARGRRRRRRPSVAAPERVDHRQRGQGGREGVEGVERPPRRARGAGRAARRRGSARGRARAGASASSPAQDRVGAARARRRPAGAAGRRRGRRARPRRVRGRRGGSRPGADRRRDAPAGPRPRAAARCCRPSGRYCFGVSPPSALPRPAATIKPAVRIKPRSRRRRTVLGATTSCYNGAPPTGSAPRPAARRPRGNGALTGYLAGRGPECLPPMLHCGRQRQSCLRFTHMSVGLGCISRGPPVFLAPMAGITDVPFRTVALRLGAGLVVSEMVASEEMVRARPSARARAELGLGDERTAVQLAGREARWMAEAARWCAGQGARIIDINFGCPAQEGDQRAVGLGADARPRSCAAADRGGGRGGRGAGDGEDAARLGRERR